MSAIVRLQTGKLLHDLNHLGSGELMVTVERMDLELAPDGKDFNAHLADGQPATRPLNPILGRATWRWNVTPLHAGNRHLLLFAYIVVKRSDGSFARYSASQDQPVIDQVVSVKVNAISTVRKWLDWAADHWPILALAGGIVGWLSNKLRKKKQQERSVTA